MSRWLGSCKMLNNALTTTLILAGLTLSTVVADAIAANQLGPNFAHDSGLTEAEIKSSVFKLRFSTGQTHYRMRYYEFDITEPAATRLSDQFPYQNNNTPAIRMVEYLVSVGNPTWHQKSDFWTRLVPWIGPEVLTACYSITSPDYAFRWLGLRYLSGNKYRALLAAGNKVPDLKLNKTNDCNQPVVKAQTAEFYFPFLIQKSLPYPFARRSFREMLRTDFEPKHLDYFGFIFVDPFHWFRFSASRTEFYKIMRGLKMRVDQSTSNEILTLMVRHNGGKFPRRM